MHFFYILLWNEKQQNYTLFLYFNFTYVFFIHKKHIISVKKFVLSLLSVFMLCLLNLAILIMLPSNSWSNGCSIDMRRHYLVSLFFFFFYFVQASFAEVICNLIILLLLKFSYDKFSKYCSFPQYALDQFVSIKKWIITDLI